MNKYRTRLKPYLLGHEHRGGDSIPIVVRDRFWLFHVSQERGLVEHTKLILRLPDFRLELSLRCLTVGTNFESVR